MLPAGAAPGSAPDAAPSGQVTGTIDVSPTVVSPSNTVGTGQRLVAITLTDADLNRPRFIGSGPNGETPSTAGARFILPTDTQQGGPGGEVRLGSAVGSGAGLASTFGDATAVPIIDRDSSGTVSLADLQFANADRLKQHHRPIFSEWR